VVVGGGHAAAERHGVADHIGGALRESRHPGDRPRGRAGEELSRPHHQGLRSVLGLRFARATRDVKAGGPARGRRGRSRPRVDPRRPAPGSTPR
ncbi:MAG: hypothetical protein ACK559_04215, partial [bacterium]